LNTVTVTSSFFRRHLKTFIYNLASRPSESPPYALAPQIQRGFPVDIVKVKGKAGRAPPERRRGAHLPVKAVEPVGGWTTESVTHGQCDARYCAQYKFTYLRT